MMRSVRYCILTALLLEATSGLNAQLEDCDFNCGTFTEKTPISYETLFPTLALFDGKIFAIGATDSRHTVSWEVTNFDTLYVYDPAADSWKKDRAPIPVPRYCPSADLVIDGKWYFPGGFTHIQVANELAPLHPAPFSRHDVYDPANDKWEMRSSLPFAINGGGTVLNGKIYITGGIKEDISPHGCVFMYDPSTDLWTQKADMHVLRYSHCIAQVGGKIYAFGGNSAYNERSETMNFNGEVYDPEKDQWSFIANPPDSMGVFLAACEEVEDEIYVIGGFVHLSDPYLATCNIYKYVPRSDQWIYVGQLPHRLISHSVIAMNRTLYILGGWEAPRDIGEKPSRRLLELRLGDITLDSLSRLQRIVQGTSETIDLSAYFRHIQGKAMSYRICMDPQFEDELSAVIEGESLKLTAIAAGYARLRVLAEEGEHRMGFDLELDVVTGTGPLQTSWNQELHVYPNPAKGSITIVFELVTPDRVHLAVHDVMGKEIATLVDESRSSGKHQVTWNTSEVPPGIYFCQLSGSVSRAFMKVIVE